MGGARARGLAHEFLSSRHGRARPGHDGSRCGESQNAPESLTRGPIYVLVLFMFEPAVEPAAEMTARHAAALARLADAAERVAMKQADRALAADDPEVEARAVTAFHRAARCARQCIALEAKLARDAHR